MDHEQLVEFGHLVDLEQVVDFGHQPVGWLVVQLLENLAPLELLATEVAVADVRLNCYGQLYLAYQNYSAAYLDDSLASHR